MGLIQSINQYLLLSFLCEVPGSQPNYKAIFAPTYKHSFTVGYSPLIPTEIITSFEVPGIKAFTFCGSPKAWERQLGVLTTPRIFAMRLSWTLGHWTNQFAWQGLYFLPISIKSKFNWQDQVAWVFLPIIHRQCATPLGKQPGAGARESWSLWSRVWTPVTGHQLKLRG